MADTVRVRSIEALRAFKAAMKDFEEAVRLSLGEANREVQRAAGWLQGDRILYWKQQRRLRENRLSDARSELMRAEMATATKTSAVVERKNVQKWKRAVEEAEQKLVNVKKWARTLEHEMSIFKAHCQPLSRIVEGDFSKAYAKLDRLYAALEKYIQLNPSVGGGAAGAGVTTVGEETSQADSEGNESDSDSGYAGDS